MRAALPESEGTGCELGRRAGLLAAEALDHVWALALPRCPGRRGGPPPLPPTPSRASLDRMWGTRRHPPHVVV